MTSTQEPNTMAPQTTLCTCSRKWKTKLIVPIYFGTKTAKFCFRIISFSSLESELSFDSEESEINFDRARSTTGKTSVWTSCLYIRNGKLDTKWKNRQTKSSKEHSRTALDGNFVT